MPVAAVRDRDAGRVAHTDLRLARVGGLDHRLELPEVW